MAVRHTCAAGSAWWHPYIMTRVFLLAERGTSKLIVPLGRTCTAKVLALLGACRCGSRRAWGLATDFLEQLQRLSAGLHGGHDGHLCRLCGRAQRAGLPAALR